MQKGVRSATHADADDVEHEYLIYTPQSPRSVLVLFHAFGFDPESVIHGEAPGDRVIRALPAFAPVADAFGLVIVAPRARGRVLEAVSLGWAQHVDAAIALATDLRASMDLQTIATGGLSMGGLEALVAAGRHSEDVDAAWAANPIVDLAAWYRDIADHPISVLLEMGVREAIATEVGGDPSTRHDAYEMRSADHYGDALGRVRVQIVWSPADTVVVRQREAHAGKLAQQLRDAGGSVDERIVTHAPPRAIEDAGRYAHESCDVWSAGAFLSGRS
jgi:pimeloyl-ACP methyl ester carboxylesterase